MVRDSHNSWSSVVDPALVLRYTRQWIHYGSITFVTFCTLVGAVRGLAGK